MRSPTLPDADTWNAMTADEQWAFLRYSAACAEYRRARASYWLAEAYAAAVVIGGLAVLAFLVLAFLVHT
jgi:hypothetical protein